MQSISFIMEYFGNSPAGWLNTCMLVAGPVPDKTFKLLFKE